MRSAELGAVWVVGSAYSLGDEAKRAAQRLGAQLALQGFRLIVGDWSGVDQLVGEAFVRELPRCRRADVGGRVLQVRRTGPSFRRHWECPGATVVEAESGDLEYEVPAMRCDACVVVAGIGGAGESARRARNHGKPVFPLPITEGDSRDLFHEIMREWRVWDVEGVTASQFLHLYLGEHYGVDAVLRMLRARLTRAPHTFVSYRRADADVAAGRLYADLIEAFGPHGVFMDAATLAAGAPWPQELQQAASNARVTIALMGTQWNPERLRDQGDWVRQELIAANAANGRVIPLLVGSAVVPNADSLPDELRWLSGRQAVKLDNEHWSARVQELIVLIEDQLVRQELAD